jgi:hypothetical protein
LQDLIFFVIIRLGQQARTPWVLASMPMAVLAFFLFHPQRTAAPGSVLFRIIAVDASSALVVLCGLDFMRRRAFLAARPLRMSADSRPLGATGTAH